MGFSLLVGIEPDKKIIENINKIRKFFNTKLYSDPFSKSDPHITLFINSFSNYRKIEKIIFEITKKFNKFNLRIEGVHIFKKNNVLSSNYILVYKISNNKNLIKLQKLLIKNLIPLKNKDYDNWLISQIENITPKLRNNIIKTGTPIDLDKYIFHTTICSVPKNEFDRTYDIIKEFDISMSFKVRFITIYIDKNKKGFKKYKKIELKD